MDQRLAWDQDAENELTRRLKMMGWSDEQAAMLRGRVEAIAQERGHRTVSIADLDEARDRAMRGRPSETPAGKQLVWDADARRDLEKETIYLRERLRQRIETFAQESGETQVTLDLVTRVRRMPSPMAAMRMGQAPPVVEPTPIPPWPVTFGDYRLNDPDGSVAICTLASEALMDEFSSMTLPDVTIVGRVFTENFGVEKVVTNIVANPRIRTLILCGTESRHRVGQTLLALHANGRNDDGRVEGAGVAAAHHSQPVRRCCSHFSPKTQRHRPAG